MGHIHVTQPPKIMPDAFLSQNAPADDTYYTVLSTTLNVRVISIEADVTWTVQPTSLTVCITVDGQTTAHIMANPVSGTAYYAITNPQAAANNQPLDPTSSSATHEKPLLEGRSVKIEFKRVGGTVSNIFCRVKYAKY